MVPSSPPSPSRVLMCSMRFVLSPSIRHFNSNGCDRGRHPAATGTHDSSADVVRVGSMNDICTAVLPPLHPPRLLRCVNDLQKRCQKHRTTRENMNVIKNGYTWQPLAYAESAVTMHCARVLASQQRAAAIITSVSSCMTMP